MTRLATITAVLLFASLSLMTPSAGTTGGHKEDKLVSPIKAICVLTSLSESKATGVVYFTQKGDEIEMGAFGFSLGRNS